MGASEILLVHGGSIIQAPMEGLSRSVELLELLVQDGPDRVLAEWKSASLSHQAELE